MSFISNLSSAHRSITKYKPTQNLQRQQQQEQQRKLQFQFLERLRIFFHYNQHIQPFLDTSMFKRLQNKVQQQAPSNSNQNNQLLPYSPNTPPPTRAPVNGGNTCYLDSLLVAMFAENDGWDGLLNVSPNTTPRIKIIIQNLIRIANDLRSCKVVSSNSLNQFRTSLTQYAAWYPGRGQHDTAELFALLLDTLHSPFVPLVKNLNHMALPDADNDHTPFTERMLWLNFHSESNNCLDNMVNQYFFGEKITGLRRNEYQVTSNTFNNTIVDATISRCLIPAYTPDRETGESTFVSRDTFNYVTVPFAVSRFSVDGKTKDVRPVIVSTALPATRYISTFGNGLEHSFILKSVICHLGNTIQSGHYVTYTYSPKNGWRRWDDLDDGRINSIRGNTETGEPMYKKWRDEIRNNCYLLFYELIPGDSLLDEEEQKKELNYSRNNKHRDTNNNASKNNTTNINTDSRNSTIRDRPIVPTVSYDAFLAEQMQMEEATAASSAAAAFNNKRVHDENIKIDDQSNKQYMLIGGGRGGSKNNNGNSSSSKDNRDVKQFSYRTPSYTWTTEGEKEQNSQKAKQEKAPQHNYNKCRKDEVLGYEWRKMRQSPNDECNDTKDFKSGTRMLSRGANYSDVGETEDRRNISHHESKSRTRSRSRSKSKSRSKSRIRRTGRCNCEEYDRNDKIGR